LNQNHIIEDAIVDSLKRAFKQSATTLIDTHKKILSVKPIMSNAFQKLYELKESIEQKYLNLTIKHQDLIKETENITRLHRKVQFYKERKLAFMHLNKN